MIHRMKRVAAINFTELINYNIKIIPINKILYN
jgi:hypothetical protein